MTGEQDPTKTPVDGPGAGTEGGQASDQQSSYDQPEGRSPSGGQRRDDEKETERSRSDDSPSASQGDSNEKADAVADVEK
jgi:hypothetical protein